MFRWLEYWPHDDRKQINSDTHANKMWSEAADRIFCNLGRELAANWPKDEESNVLVHLLNVWRNIPSKKLQVMIVIEVCSATNYFNHDDLKRKRKFMWILCKSSTSCCHVERSSVKQYPLPLKFDLFLDTRRRLNMMQTNWFLMHRFVCLSWQCSTKTWK